MKVPLLCLFILLLAIVARAEEADYRELISKTERYLMVYPDDQGEKLNLAYYYMMSAQPDSALTLYRGLRAADGFAERAAGGELWALNTLGRYQEAIKTSRELMREFPDNPDLLNNLALAYLQTGFPQKARTGYSRAFRLSQPATPSFEIAADGLGWSYLALNDFAKAELALRATDADKHQKISSKLGQPRLDLSFGIGYKDSLDTLLLAGITAGWRTWSLSLSANQYRVDGDHYSSGLAVSLKNQFAPIEISVSGRGLTGTDEMAYPAWQAGLNASSRIWLPNSFIAPRLTALYAYYPSFSSLQADFGFWAGNDRVQIGIGYSGLILDNESPDADTRGRVYSASVDLRLWRSVNLAGYFSTGDMEWWTSPYGTLIDSFETSDTICGVGLKVPLGKVISLQLYQQIGFLNDQFSLFGQGQILVHI